MLRTTEGYVSFPSGTLAIGSIKPIILNQPQTLNSNSGYQMFENRGIDLWVNYGKYKKNTQ